MTSLQQLLDEHRSSSEWTEKDMVDWLQSLSEDVRKNILDTMIQYEDMGKSPLYILKQLRIEYESQSNYGFFDILVAALTGYAEGVAIVDGPRAIKNLARMS